MKGFGVIEIVVVVGLISTVLLGMTQLAVLSIRPIHESVRQGEALYLADETLEVMHLQRNAGWTANIASLSTGTTYYPVISGGNWTLSTTDPGPFNGTFSRSLVIDEVYRDANDDISTSGTLDTESIKVTSTVSWVERAANPSVVVSTYLTNFLNN